MYDVLVCHHFIYGYTTNLAYLSLRRKDPSKRANTQVKHSAIKYKLVEHA